MYIVQILWQTQETKVRKAYEKICFVINNIFSFYFLIERAHYEDYILNFCIPRNFYQN